MENIVLEASDGYALSLAVFEREHPRGYIQIIHGMEEHKERYEAFAEQLWQAGFTVVTSDMRGHGNHHCKESALYPVTQLRKGGTERIPELSGNTDYPHRVFPDEFAHKGAWTDVSFQAGAATVSGKF